MEFCHQSLCRHIYLAFLSYFIIWHLFFVHVSFLSLFINKVKNVYTYLTYFVFFVICLFDSIYLNVLRVYFYSWQRLWWSLAVAKYWIWICHILAACKKNTFPLYSPPHIIFFLCSSYFKIWKHIIFTNPLH